MVKPEDGKERRDETARDRMQREHEERVDRLASIPQEMWEKALKEQREDEERKAKELFGDKKPTIYIDRYTDL